MRGATSRASGAGACCTEFQSTLPMRGATSAPAQTSSPRTYFNPHSPCGERRSQAPARRAHREFQSTLPMRGATRPVWMYSSTISRFQSTLPMRGATSTSTTATNGNNLFQSTLPMRGATRRSRPSLKLTAFQSTLPMRGATANIAKTIFVNLYDLSRSRGSIINI